MIKSKASLPSPVPPLDRLRARLRSGVAVARTLAYHDHRTRPNLVELLEVAAVPEAEGVLVRLRACRRYSPCRMYTCPNCGPKLKARAKDDALNRIVGRLGRFPKDVEVSFLTLRGPTLDLDPEQASIALARFKRRIVKFQQRQAASTSWYGFFDVSLIGLLHWHGVVLHPDTPRNELEAHLKGSFPEEDQVVIRQWKSSQSLAENLQGVFNYSLVADRHAKVFVLRDGPDRHHKLVHGRDGAARIANRMNVIQSLCGRGVQGIRLALNMKATVRGLIVEELEKLTRSTKKRINRKTMLNLEWAPRGVYGTHLGLGKNPNQVGIRKVPIVPETDVCSDEGANRGTEAGALRPLNMADPVAERIAHRSRIPSSRSGRCRSVTYSEQDHLDSRDRG
jgi:hypothetical protein